MSEPVTLSAPFGLKPLVFETGKMANLADGAVTVRYGDTVVLVTAVSSWKIKDGQDFFPLTVEYRERAAAAGKIPGGYFKREGRPSEKEILTCRMTDRPLRPLFPKGYLYDTQIITTLLSADGENEPDILSINGASAALMVSDIPFAGPIGAVRVGRVDGAFLVNPTHSQRTRSDLDLVYVGTADEVLMIEGSAQGALPEAEFKKALEFAHRQIQVSIDLQKLLANRAGRPKREVALHDVPVELARLGADLARERLAAIMQDSDKSRRRQARRTLEMEITPALLEAHPGASPYQIGSLLEDLEADIFRRTILDEGRRSDGRGDRDVRKLAGETGLLPRTHGSALFSRGETQALCMTTLASLEQAQELDSYTGGDQSKRFILHYNFPPSSVGETGRVGGTNRREIGHGALAERSLVAVLPPADEFPYAIRVTSEILASNGSTSMASVCGGCLALMDAGVPIREAVAGISVGLVTGSAGDGTPGRHRFLTDITGSEDHHGDMDFKLSGTRDSITGFQLDLKLPGISVTLLGDAVDRSHEARLQILDFMETILPRARPELSAHAPRVEAMRIPTEKIGLLIGPGGKTIRGIIADTGAEISVEDDGSVKIFAVQPESVARARQAIEALVAEIEAGRTYEGRIVTVKDFGVFVQVLPGKEGLVHISEWDFQRIGRMEDVARVGDMISVKCIGVDDRGRAKLSRKAALPARA